MAYMKPSNQINAVVLKIHVDLYHPENIKKAPSHGTLNLNVRVKELNRIDRANDQIKDKLV